MTPADPHPRDRRRRRDAHTVKAIEQLVYRAHAMDKVELLARILQADGRGLTMIFSRTKRTASQGRRRAQRPRLRGRRVHGDLGQGAREQALRAFRNGKIDILVATDVAARGIDVDNVTHVINYQCPEDEKTYLHRVGRTGARRQHRCRGHLRRLGRPAALGLINQALGLGIPEPAGDLLQLRPPLHRPRHPRAAPRAGCGRPQQTRPASTPRSSRTSARPASGTASPAPVPGRSWRAVTWWRPRSRAPDRSGRAVRTRSRPTGESVSEAAAGESRPRRSRNRRRTRGAGAAAAVPPPRPAWRRAAGRRPPAEGSSDAEGGSRPPRRRRRGGSGRGGAGRTESAPATSATE